MKFLTVFFCLKTLHNLKINFQLNLRASLKVATKRRAGKNVGRESPLKPHASRFLSFFLSFFWEIFFIRVASTWMKRIAAEEKAGKRPHIHVKVDKLNFQVRGPLLDFSSRELFVSTCWRRTWISIEKNWYRPFRYLEPDASLEIKSQSNQQQWSCVRNRNE